MPSSPKSIAGVPSSQALPGFFITTPPSVCVPDVIGALAVWIQNQKKVSDSFPVFIFFFGTNYLTTVKLQYIKLYESKIKD